MAKGPVTRLQAEANAERAKDLEAAAHQAALEEAQARRKARAVELAEPRRLALADGKRARGHTADVFGVPLGTALVLPDCEKIGTRDGSGLPSGELFSLAHSFLASEDDLVAPKTCLRVMPDGSTALVWGEGIRPSWAVSVSVQVMDDVAVSVEIGLPPPAVPVTCCYNNVTFWPRKRKRDEEASQKVPARAASRQKELEKQYGPATRVGMRKAMTNGGDEVRIEEREWILPGIHVLYSASRYEDSLLIELASVFEARKQSAK